VCVPFGRFAMETCVFDGNSQSASSFFVLLQPGHIRYEFLHQPPGLKARLESWPARSSNKQWDQFVLGSSLDSPWPGAGCPGNGPAHGHFRQACPTYLGARPQPGQAGWPGHFRPASRRATQALRTTHLSHVPQTSHCTSSFLGRLSDPKKNTQIGPWPCLGILNLRTALAMTPS
jgi:hypothetical protein